jgi:hypothetical protein
MTFVSSPEELKTILNLISKSSIKQLQEKKENPIIKFHLGLLLRNEEKEKSLDLIVCYFLN